MLLIREACTADVAELVQMGKRFFDASGYGKIVAFDEMSVIKTLSHLIDDENGIILVSGDPIDGAIGALLYPFYFNINHKTGQEIFWWVDHPGHGMRLIQELEKMAKQKGCSSFSMVEIDGLKPVSRIYKRRGYIPSDHTFIKVL